MGPMKPNRALPLILALVTMSCSSIRQPIAERSLQKRRYQPGWHFDLGVRHNGTIPVRRSRVSRLEPRTFDPAIPTREPLASNLSDEPIDVRGPRIILEPTTPIRAGHYRPQDPIPLEQTTLPSPANITGPDARWNPWAGPALVLALGTIAYGLVGTSLWIAVLGVIATLILASIAVRKGRTYEWRGKGFAVAALVIGVLAALVTLIAVLGS